MSELLDGDFIVALESKIRALEKRRGELQEAVTEFNTVEDQLHLLRRTRNAFVHGMDGPRPAPPPQAALRALSPPQAQTHLSKIMETIAAEHTRGKLSQSLLSLLQEVGRPLHSDEIMTRLRQMGFKASRPTIVGALARFYRDGKLSRPKPGVYAIKD